MGESDRSKTAKSIDEQLASLTREIKGLDTGVTNRFDDYNVPFNYGAMSKLIDEITKSNIGSVNRQAEEEIQTGQGDLAERLAGAGVTSSSIKESQLGKVRDTVGRRRSNLAEQIYGQGLSGKLGAMNEANRFDFATTQRAQDVDLANISNLFNKYGLVQGGYGQRMNNLQNISDDTFLTDLFSGINTLSQFIPFLPSGGSGGGAGRAGG